MENRIIEDYISANYSKWLKRVRRHCYLRELKGVVAEDVLQDVMYVLFKKKTDGQIVEMILAQAHANASLLDLFISRAIRHQIFNENKHEIVVKRTVTSGLDLNLIKVTEPEQMPDQDVYDRQRQLSVIIDALCVDEKIQRILHWKLVNNHNICDFKGDPKQVGKLYNAALPILKRAALGRSESANY